MLPPGDGSVSGASGILLGGGGEGSGSRCGISSPSYIKLGLTSPVSLLTGSMTSCNFISEIFLDSTFVITLSI